MEKFFKAIVNRNSETVEKLLFSLLPKVDDNKPTLQLKEKQSHGNKAKISPRQKWHQQEKASTITPGSNNSKGASEAPTVSEKSTHKKPSYRVSPAVPLKAKATIVRIVKSLSQEMREAEEKKKLLLEELRQIDHKLKELKLKDKLSRKPKELLPQDAAEQTKKALELVRKLNEERRYRELKKQREAEQQQLRAQKSIGKIAELRRAREEEKYKRIKEMTEKKQKERENRSLLRHLNTESDKLIEDMRKHNSVFDLTSVQDDVQPKPRILRKKYPPTHFLETIITEEKALKRQEEMKERQKKLMLQKRKSYNTIVEKMRAGMIGKPRQQSIELHYQYEHSPIVAKRLDSPQESTLQ